MNASSNVKHLSLYQYNTCPFCLMTQAAIKKTGLSVEHRNTQSQAKYRTELISEGGKSQVPCLRIERDNGKVDWLYESNDIIRWVNAYATQQQNAA